MTNYVIILKLYDFKYYLLFTSNVVRYFYYLMTIKIIIYKDIYQ